MFCKKGVLKNFTKFIGKHLCWSLFFNKVAGLSPETLLKKRLQHRCFFVNFVKFFKNTFFKEHLWWLLSMQKIYFCQFFVKKKVLKQIFSQLSGLTSSNRHTGKVGPRTLRWDLGPRTFKWGPMVRP